MAASLFSFTLTKIGMSKAGLVGANDYSVTEIRELQRRLKSINPELRRQLVRDAKKAGEPAQSAIKSAIAQVTPLSGMTRGRLNWNSSVDAKGKAHKPTDVKLEFRTRSSGRSDTTSLVRIKVASPAVVMADMAGRSGNFMGKGYRGTGLTREYAYKGGTRRHRVDGNGIKNPNRPYKYQRQGDSLLANLGGRASRYVWPAAESKIPAIKAEIETILKKAYSDINRKGL